MNTTIKLGAAGALAFGAIAAHASISQPSTGASDAILFANVVNAAGTAVVASYAGDTGVSVSTLAAGLSGTQTVLLGDANLAKLFAADTGTNKIEWAVQGGQYPGSTDTGTFGTPGAAQFISTSTLNSVSKLKTDNTGSLTSWAALNADVSQLNINTGGAVSVEGGSAAAAGVWDYTVPSGTSGWYLSGPATANVLGTPTTAENLYYVTGAGGTVTKVAYAVEGTATLTAGGLVLAAAGGTGGNPPPVPLPAAFWLLGSGLLGLTGVARRKLKV